MDGDMQAFGGYPQVYAACRRAAAFAAALEKELPYT
jgi:hypothetical protein